MNEERGRYMADTEAGSSGFFSALVEGRKGEILDAALVVFAEKGYEAGTMREIAALVGVSEPALYRHYAGKEALLVSLVEEAGAHLVSTAARRIEGAQPSNFREVFKSLLRDRYVLLHSNAGLMSTLLVSAHHNAPAREALERAVIEPMIGNLRAFVKRMDALLGVGRTEADLSVKVRLAINLLVGHLLTARFLHQQPDDEGLVSALASLMGWPDTDS